MGMKSKKNVKPNTPGKKNIKNMKKVGQVKQNALLKKRLKSVLGPTASNDNKIKIKTDNASKAMNSSLISSAINDKKFILRIEESESDEYFKKKPRNVQESKQSSDQDDKPKVNGIAAVDMSSTEVTKTSKKKNKKLKNKSKQERNGSTVDDNEESMIKSQNKIEDETETVPEDCREQSKPATQDKEHTVKQKLQKSKKLKKAALKEFAAKNVVMTIETDKGNKKKLINNNKYETPEISQECLVPERKKPCKKSKQTKLEKEKTNNATERKNKKEKNVVSSLKAKEKDGTSDSDRSSYIQQFFEDTAVDSRDEQMDESESIYEDESEYDDYMSDSETDKGKSEDDGGAGVKPEQKPIQKANEISEGDDEVVNYMKLTKKKKAGLARKDSNNSPEETAKAKGGGSKKVSDAEESVDDEEGAGSGDAEEGDESDNGEGEESNDNEKVGESDDDKESKESDDDEEGEDSDNHEKYEKSADNNKKRKSKKMKKARKIAKTKGGDVNMISVAEFSGEESVGDGECEKSGGGDESEESDDHEEDGKSFDDKRRKLMKKKKAGTVSRDSNNSPEQIKRKDRSPNMVSVGEFFGEESVDDEEGEDEEESEGSGDEEKGESGDNEEGEESDDDEEDDQSIDDGDDEENISRFDRRLLKNWKNINFFYNNYCSEDENDRDSFFQKQPSKKKSVQTYGTKVDEDDSENSDYCCTDDYGSDQSGETDEEEYDSSSGEEDSSYYNEYDEEEEATSYSEETDEDGSYSYDFEEESHDEDYELPEGEVEDVIVRHGKARIYDMDEHNVSFDSDSPQIIDLGSKAESESSLSTALVPMRRSQVKEDPKIEEKDDPESDDSCPQLVPINYDLAPSDCYDYEFSDDDDDDFSEDNDSQEFDSGDSESEQQSQEENTASEISECKLITYDGEKTVAYNLRGVEQNASLEQKEETSKEMKEKTEEKIKVNKKSKKRKASETLLNEDEQKDPPKKIESKKRKNNEKSYEGKSLLHPEDIQYIKLDDEVDDSRLNDMDVVEEATLGDSQFETKEAHTSLQNQASEAKENIKNLEELKIQKPQGWQIEVNLKTKSFFYNSFHSRYVLIILKDYLYFNGALKIKLLLGSAEVFGYILQKDEEVQSYSIHGGALLDLSPRTSEKAVTEDEIDNQLSLYSQDLLSSDVAQIKKEFDRKRDALILLSRNDNTKKIEMVRRYMRENLFPTMTGLDVGSSSYISQFILHSVFHNFDRRKCITFNNQWLDIKLNSNTKLAIIGGKSVGKSTLLRYTINRHLNKFKKILLIDLDIGQQEAFVPQTVTATVIEKPILGPGYLFTKSPTKSFLFGHINVVINLLFYIRNVAKLFEFCYEQNEFRDIPWVINTMGYTHGFGYDLMAAVFNVARPNFVVQIQSRKNKENFSRDMYAENVRRTRFALLEEYLKGINDLSYQLKIIRSVAGGGFGRFRMGAKDSRFCMILARLGTILKEQHDWLTDVRPYSVSYDDISIVSFSEHSVDDKESLLDIINANLVYLCKKEPGSEITECFGIGIVRGVDKAQRKVFVIASLEVKTLRLVNTLAVCNIPIPTSLLLNQGPKVKGAIPYTYNTQNNAFTKHIYQYNSAHFFKGGQNTR